MHGEIAMTLTVQIRHRFQNYKYMMKQVRSEYHNYTDTSLGSTCVLTYIGPIYINSYYSSLMQNISYAVMHTFFKTVLLLRFRYSF